MSYDVFTSVPEPKINISLFGDAAAQGVQVGNALPTKTTSIIRGAQEGIETGLNWLGKVENIQSANLAQERTQQIIDAEPLEQQYRQEQLNRLKTVNEIEQNQLKLSKITEEHDLKLKLQQSKNALTAAEQQAKDFDTEQAIGTAISSTDKNQRLSILNNPSYQQYMLRKPQVGEQVLGALYNDLTPEQRESAMARIDYAKKMQMDSEKQRLQYALDQRVLAGYEKSQKELTNEVDLSGIIKGRNADQLVDLEVVPSGTYFVDGKTMQKDTSKKGTPIPGAGYEVYDGSTRIAAGISHSAAVKLQSFQNAHEKYLEMLDTRLGAGKQKEGEAAPEVTQASMQTAAAPAKAQPSAAQQASKFGIQPKAISAIEEVAGARAKEAGWLESNLPTWLTGSPVERALAETVNATPDDTKMKAAIEETAAEKTRNALSVLKSGTSEEKQDLRDWAKGNGIELTPKSLNQYYKYRIKDELSGVYDEAFNAGLDKRAEQNRVQSGISAQQDLDNQVLEGRSAEEALSIRKQAREKLGMSEKPAGTPTAQTQTSGAAPIPGNAVPTSVAALAALEPLTRQAAQKVFEAAAGAIGLNLKSKATQSVQKRVVEVLADPYLVASPNHVKAVAAVESGGNENAVSSTGVRGLMQVSRKVASSYGLNRNIPEENVEAGTRYLTDLIKMFSGEKALAYAAYNAGPGVIKYAQKLAGGATDWNTVKKHLYEALKKYEKQVGVPASEKLKEAYNYPEKVMLHEALFDKSQVA